MCRIRHPVADQEIYIVGEAYSYEHSTTSLAKTVISENEGIFVGTYADGASFPATRDYVEKADAVLALGVIFTDDYLTMLSQQFNQMILVNNDGTLRLGQAYYHQVYLADFIAQFTERIKKFLFISTAKYYVSTVTASATNHSSFVATGFKRAELF